MGKGRGGVKWEAGEYREWEETGDGVEDREMGIHEKISPKRNIFVICGCPFGATAPCHTFLESSFHGQNPPRR